jgi:hypothetical protein
MFPNEQSSLFFKRIKRTNRSCLRIVSFNFKNNHSSTYDTASFFSKKLIQKLISQVLILYPKTVEALTPNFHINEIISDCLTLN